MPLKIVAVNWQTLALQTLKSPQIVDYLGAFRQTWLSFAVFLVREPEPQKHPKMLINK
jgi:hypothetical protein